MEAIWNYIPWEVDMAYEASSLQIGQPKLAFCSSDENFILSRNFALVSADDAH